MAKGIALAGQERMAQMDTEEVTNFAFQMLKGYAALQRFKPKRDPRSWEVNCEDDLTRHYDRGGETKWRYLTQVSSSSSSSSSRGGETKWRYLTQVSTPVSL